MKKRDNLLLLFLIYSINVHVNAYANMSCESFDIYPSREDRCIISGHCKKIYNNYYPAYIKKCSKDKLFIKLLKLATKWSGAKVTPHQKDQIVNTFATTFNPATTLTTNYQADGIVHESYASLILYNDLTKLKNIMSKYTETNKSHNRNTFPFIIIKDNSISDFNGSFSISFYNDNIYIKDQNSYALFFLNISYKQFNTSLYSYELYWSQKFDPSPVLFTDTTYTISSNFKNNIPIIIKFPTKYKDIINDLSIKLQYKISDFKPIKDNQSSVFNINAMPLKTENLELFLLDNELSKNKAINISWLPPNVSKHNFPRELNNALKNNGLNEVYKVYIIIKDSSYIQNEYLDICFKVKNECTDEIITKSSVFTSNDIYIPSELLKEEDNIYIPIFKPKLSISNKITIKSKGYKDQEVSLNDVKLPTPFISEFFSTNPTTIEMKPKRKITTFNIVTTENLNKMKLFYTINRKQKILERDFSKTLKIPITTNSNDIIGNQFWVEDLCFDVKSNNFASNSDCNENIKLNIIKAWAKKYASISIQDAESTVIEDGNFQIDIDYSNINPRQVKVNNSFNNDIYSKFFYVKSSTNELNAKLRLDNRFHYIDPITKLPSQNRLVDIVVPLYLNNKEKTDIILSLRKPVIATVLNRQNLNGPDLLKVINIIKVITSKLQEKYFTHFIGIKASTTAGGTAADTVYSMDYPKSSEIENKINELYDRSRTDSTLITDQIRESFNLCNGIVNEGCWITYFIKSDRSLKPTSKRIKDIDNIVTTSNKQRLIIFEIIDGTKSTIFNKLSQYHYTINLNDENNIKNNLFINFQNCLK